MMTLNELKPGQQACIQHIADTDIATQAMRLGITTGEMIVGVANIPAGPVVIQRGGMELAIGHDLCQQIHVLPVGAV